MDDVKLLFPGYKIVERYNFGEIIGEEQILKNIRRTTTIYTKNDCYMLTINKEIFNKLIFQIRYKKMRETVNKKL